MEFNFLFVYYCLFIICFFAYVDSCIFCLKSCIISSTLQRYSVYPEAFVGVLLNLKGRFCQCAICS